MSSNKIFPEIHEKKYEMAEKMRRTSQFSTPISNASELEYGNEETAKESFDWFRKNVFIPLENSTNAAVKREVPTDAYGEIEFGNNKTAKYVRVGHKTPLETLKHLLIAEWKMELPKIIISVTGGAQDFKLRRRLTEEFKKSLIKAAKNTGAWIVTGGTHSGVMKLVGEAIHAHASDEVVALGIATWGILQNRNELKNKKKNNENYSNEEPDERVKYTAKSPKSLDEHHTHFILVDDGSTGEFGKEIELRAKLEECIAEKTNDVTNDVPVVCIIVQGGPGSLAAVYNALQCNTPVVIVGDSGGWANILAELCNKNFDSVIDKDVSRLLKDNELKVPVEEKLTDLTNKARECVRRKDLITVFKLDQLDGAHELDNTILKAIIKSVKINKKRMLTGNDESRTHQGVTPSSANNGQKGTSESFMLDLALSWNRADIARTDILTDDVILDSRGYVETFLNALKQNKAEFVQLLLYNNLKLEDHFKEEDLYNLYNEANLLEKKKNKDEWFKMIDKKKLSLLDKRCWNFDTENFLRDKRQGVLRELFIWCIISNKKECSHVLWKFLDEDLLAAAVFASSLLKSQMDKKEYKSKEEKEALIEHASDYKQLAYGILSECYNENSDQTSEILQRKLKHWGNVTCLELAAAVKEKDFVSHPAVQNFLDKIWYGVLKKPEETLEYLRFTTSVVICNYFFFFLVAIPGLIKFEDQLKFKEESQIMRFYRAPVVKFHLTVLFYLIFLFLFGFILLSNFYTNASGFEYALIAWVLALGVEEVRQLRASPTVGLKKKLNDYINQLGNKLDLFAFVLFFIGFGLRFAHQFGAVDSLYPARVLLCIAFIAFSLRILSMFTVNKQLGPKLLMVRRMVVVGMTRTRSALTSIPYGGVALRRLRDYMRFS